MSDVCLFIRASCVVLVMNLWQRYNKSLEYASVSCFFVIIGEVFPTKSTKSRKHPPESAIRLRVGV